MKRLLGSRLAGRIMPWLILRHALLRNAVVMGVRVILLDQEGRVFLVRHSYVPGWHFPGGGVEFGETVRAAAIREVREEAGLSVGGAMPLLGVYLNGALFDRNHVAVFVAREFTPLAAPKSDWEIEASGFFPLSELPPETTPSTRARLAEALDGAPLSETW